ncbi:hypothetical protein CDN99_19825 [Roseateles aquatilis]|uniref:Uncharacterized protein n=1 Tax=Roseateles aquatilis TaxID=431061 RepID=A0A246J3C8_9BURK|nr:hypothetical protein [Roseateles aquatilis]OWQ86952.1 hypothetical protein CDN99_19825 [Roseateles aquatilis]
MATPKPCSPLPPKDDDTLVGPPVSATLEALRDTSDDPAAQAARAEALEQLALSHAMCDQAAEACFYLCRSLGLARQQQAPDAEPDLELLFQLLGALADLPAEVSALPLPEGEADGLGVAELCHQLGAARELTTAAWHDAAEQDQAVAPCPAAPARALH